MSITNSEMQIALSSGVDLRREGGGGGVDPFSGIRTPADPKGLPLYYFPISIFGDGPFGANIYQF